MKNASIEKITKVVSHPNADRLDLVSVLGYQCVTEKGLHKTGDIIIYVQPDSVLPIDELWAEGYRKYAPSRIRAVKFRGEFSEGIIIKLDQVKGLIPVDINLEEGLDVSDYIKVIHYEPPVPNDLSAKGLLPYGIPKTDETRWENKIGSLPIDEVVDVTLKIDGQSWSAYYNVNTKEFGVLGRTREFKEIAQNKYTAHIKRYDIKTRLIEFCEANQVSLCIRGESYGPGIQSFGKNPHAKLSDGVAIFSVFNIDTHRYENKGDKYYFIDVARELELPTVPILEKNVVLVRDLIDKYSIGIKKINGAPFEGVVIKHGPYQITKHVILIDENIPEDKREFDDTKHYEGGSFKIINKDYDSNK